MLRQINRFFGGIGAGAGDNRDAPVSRFHTGRNQALVFVAMEGRCFTRCAAGNKSMSAAGDMPFDKLLKGVKIDFAFFERRDERNRGPMKLFHFISPLKFLTTLLFLRKMSKRSCISALFSA